MTPFYVYALADPIDGKYRYIGGAYGNANRINEHGTTRNGARSLRPWFAEMTAVGRTAVRKVLFTADSADEVRWAEPATWRTYKAKGHPLLNACPGKYPLNIHSPEANAKRAAANTGQKRSLETCAKISAALRGKKSTAEACAINRSSHKGKTHTSETRARMSATRSGRTYSIAHRAAISAGKTGKKFSSEHCANISAAKKGKKIAPEVRAGMRGWRHTMESREKISAAMRGKTRGPYKQKEKA